MRCTCNCTSKDLNSSSFLLAFRQNLDKQINSPKKQSSQKSSPKNPLKINPPKKILLKKSFQKISPKKFLQNIFAKKFLKKSFRNIPKNFQTISQKIPNNLKIPYIALRGRKPFRACFFFLSSKTGTRSLLES